MNKLISIVVLTITLIAVIGQARSASLARQELADFVADMKTKLVVWPPRIAAYIEKLRSSEPDIKGLKWILLKTKPSHDELEQLARPVSIFKKAFNQANLASFERIQMNFNEFAIEANPTDPDYKQLQKLYDYLAVCQFVKRHNMW